jgi:transposase
MRNFCLTNDQLAELRMAHRLERNRSAAYKINAVILLGTDWKLKQVKKVLLLDDETLRSYVEKYKSGGVKNLLKTNYRGRECQLTEDQQELICEALESTIFLTTSAVIDYVENKFEIQYTASGMRSLLHRLGYVFKKPKLVPGNPDRELQG